MDRLQSMRVFREVVDQGGFAAAARRLDLAPAVVTRLVDDLEKSLGVRLLQRTTRRVSLTQEGEEYLARLRGILTDIEEAHDVVRSHTGKIAGTLRLLTAPAAAVNLVTPVVARFQDRHPDCRVEVHIAEDPASAIEEYDLTVLRDDGSLDASIVVRPVFESEVVLAASPGYLRAHGTPRKPEDLATHRLLRYHRRGLRLPPLVLSHGPSGRQVEVDAVPSLLANDSDVLVRAAIEHAGIGVQIGLSIAQELATGQLQRVLPSWAAGSLRVVAAMPSRRFLPMRTRAFLDFLVEEARRTLSDPRLRQFGARAV
jgi:DNA-binding transcriptional LysR family regulator